MGQRPTEHARLLRRHVRVIKRSIWRKPNAALASSLVGSALHLVLDTDAKTVVPRPPTSPHASPHARRTGPQAQPRGRRPDLFRHLRTSVILEQGENMLV